LMRMSGLLKEARWCARGTTFAQQVGGKADYSGGIARKFFIFGLGGGARGDAIPTYGSQAKHVRARAIGHRFPSQEVASILPRESNQASFGTQPRKMSRI
jgi:hypothetical protein